MNVLIAPDSYKNSLSAAEVASHIKNGILRVFKDTHFKLIPMADGGEGTVDAMINNLGGHFEYAKVTGPLGKPVLSKFGILENGSTVLEMSAASGLPLVPLEKRDVMKATTYGTGEMIKKALNTGCSNIYIGIGGSATNDGGLGMAQALGAHFTNALGNEVGFGGECLSSIENIDLSEMDPRLKNVTITAMCDVTNPLCGPEGASYVYGPQKGASQKQVKILDEGLLHLTKIMTVCGLDDFKQIPGSGAAGGLGMGLMAFANAKLCSGINAILEAANFEEKLNWADIVITGEGRLDEQSAFGKVLSGISKYAMQYNVPVIAIVGCIGEGARTLYDYGIDTIESCIYKPITLEKALSNAAANVEDAAERAMRAIRIGMKIS